MMKKPICMIKWGMRYFGWNFYYDERIKAVLKVNILLHTIKKILFMISMISYILKLLYYTQIFNYINISFNNSYLNDK
ncbi:unnamed protein product [Paramecium sonneborni]|uniref:Uncharacterized protein n=1 Tax=Paramecium sonneborni TaxID=65129 RepID=A0A8S1Q9S9_9CILI|nr:unnamed protein product [Paramecium sonneborni]